jgi:hypothetical protein
MTEHYFWTAVGAAAVALAVMGIGATLRAVEAFDRR